LIRISYKERFLTHLEAIKGGLIVSCQALEDEPLHGTVYMVGMARAALMAGAVGIRANGPEDIAGIRRLTDKPIIGILKKLDQEGKVFITPDLESAALVAQAGADIVAADCTVEHHPDSAELKQLIDSIHSYLDVPVMADCSNLAEAVRAERLGADLVATTLAGGTEPDFGLLEAIVNAVQVPVIAEGNYWHPEEVVKAIRLGAHAVVVGSAITRPQAITARFVSALRRG